MSDFVSVGTIGDFISGQGKMVTVSGRHVALFRLGDEFYAELTASFTAKRDRLCAGLLAAGLQPLRPAGTYFVNATIDGDGVGFCRELPERAGVVAIPTSVFYDHEEVGRSLVRFAFCKRDTVIDEAAARLAQAR